MYVYIYIYIYIYSHTSGYYETFLDTGPRGDHQAHRLDWDGLRQGGLRDQGRQGADEDRPAALRALQPGWFIIMILTNRVAEPVYKNDINKDDIL